MDQIKSFLDVSESDLKASICLYKNGFYPQAIFYLQQSVEKAAKAFGLLVGVIKFSDLMKIRHKTLKVHKAIVENLENRLDTIYRIEQDHQVGEILSFLDIKSIRKSVTEFHRQYGRIMSGDIPDITEERIDEIIQELNNLEFQIHQAINSINSRVENSISDSILDMFEYFKGWGINIEFDTKEILDLSKAIARKIIPYLLDGTYVSVALFNLGLVTFVHVSSSRYPEKVNPLEIYNEKHPIIRKFQELTEIMEKILDKLRNLYMIKH